MSEENTEKTKSQGLNTLEKTSKKSSTKKSTKKADPQDEFLSNFNWHQYQEGIDKIDEKQIKEFEKLRSATFEDLMQLDSIGNVVAKNIIEFFIKFLLIKSQKSNGSKLAFSEAFRIFCPCSSVPVRKNTL